MKHELTLCSVSFNSAGFLRLNERLTRELNPSAALRWIVAENSPTASADCLGAADAGAFDLLEGSGPGHIPNFHHTLALRACTQRANTRFVAVIDPDLFVMRPHWVSEVIEHMQRHELSFIGVPWHPQSLGKYRYFPAVHFTVFDTDRFQREDIDFLPDHPDGDNDPAWAAGWTVEGNYFVRSAWARLLSRLPYMAPRRQHYTDTGSRFFKRWVDNPAARREVLVPRWQAPAPSASMLRRALQALMPDELSYTPKHYPAASLALVGPMAAAADLPAHWECFEWQRELFCFHVRGNLARQSRSAETELEVATRLAQAALAVVKR